MIGMRFRKLWFGFVMIALLGMAAGAANTASAAAAETTRTGVVQELDFANGTMIISGYRYHTAPELRVEIGGSFGAFTMLQVGMKVQIAYRVVSASRRDVFEVKQIPDNYAIEEA